MSDLTITNAGVTVETGAPSVKSNNQKLTQMTMKIINVVPTIDTNAHASGDLLFNPTKVENAVSVAGGSGIVQSIQVINGDGLLGDFDIMFIQESSAGAGVVPTMASLNAELAASSSCSDLNMTLNLGKASISNMEDAGASSIGSQKNIGLVIQAMETTRDVYIWGIARSTDNPTSATGYTIRIGIIQD